MRPKPLSKRGHRAGQWLTTNTSGSPLPIPDITSGGGADDVIVIVAFYIAYAVVIGFYRTMFRRPTAKWGDYEGMVFCQIYNDDLRFFKTVRSTTRVVLPPAALTRPLAELTKFETITTSPPKLTFAFTDGLKLELYLSDDVDEANKFQELVNLAINKT